MKFMGSKSRHAKEIISVIAPYRRENQLWVEPFVGGCNMIDKIYGPRLGSDIDADLICLWQAVSDGWNPPEKITEREYNDLKKSPSTPLKGYAAFALSFGGKKWGGWARGSNSAGLPRKYDEEAWRNSTIQFPKLRGVDFRHSSYQDLDIPEGSVIYCDPPYQSTTKYAHKFDHLEFWEWCRKKSQYNELFVSEYAAPDDFVCIWEKGTTVSIHQKRGNSPAATERLFKLRGKL